MTAAGDKYKNHRQKIPYIIITIVFLMPFLWWLYIIAAVVLIPIWLIRKKNKATNRTHKDNSTKKPSYWDNDKTNPLLMVTTVLCPLAVVVIISRYHKLWTKHLKIVVPLVVWTTVWFLGLAYVTHVASVYTHPTYISSVDIKSASADKYDKQVPRIPTATQVASPTARTTNKATTQTQKANQATSVMSGITMANPESVPYDRSEYQPNWSAGGGCDIRSRLLTATSIIKVTYGSNGCTVKYGSWKDPYTGHVLTGNPYQGDGTANDLDIDHIIPLNYVNSHGGYRWSSVQKRAYGDSLTAMNNGVYLAVSASENRKKGDSGPSAYYPPSSSYRCEYSTKWRDTARTYNIALSPADYRLIASILVSCGVN